MTNLVFEVCTLSYGTFFFFFAWIYALCILHFLGYESKWKKPGLSLNPFTPSSDQDRISPYNINTISSRQVISR